jgi:hypothetical protein
MAYRAAAATQRRRSPRRGGADCICGRTFVGVVLQRLPPVGLLDIGVARALVDLQQLVVALVVHGPALPHPCAAPSGEAARETAAAEEHGCRCSA